MVLLTLSSVPERRSASYDAYYIIVVVLYTVSRTPQYLGHANDQKNIALQGFRNILVSHFQGCSCNLGHMGSRSSGR